MDKNYTRRVPHIRPAGEVVDFTDPTVRRGFLDELRQSDGGASNVPDSVGDSNGSDAKIQYTSRARILATLTCVGVAAWALASTHASAEKSERATEACVAAVTGKNIKDVDLVQVAEGGSLQFPQNEASRNAMIDCQRNGNNIQAALGQ